MAKLIGLILGLLFVAAVVFGGCYFEAWLMGALFAVRVAWWQLLVINVLTQATVKGVGAVSKALTT